MLKKTFFAASAAAAILALAPLTHGHDEHNSTSVAHANPGSQLGEVTPGAYTLDKTHAHLTIYVGHLGGISDYRINFTDFDATLDFQPENLTASTLSMSVNPLSVATNYPGDYKKGHANSGFESWDEDIARNATWLNADKFPKMSFTTTNVEKTGDNTGKVTGDLELLGVKKPITFDVTFNGVANPPWYGDRDVIGFNAETTIKRSEFSMDHLIPNVTDDVKITFSGEFLKDQ
ncbi:MAG: YceI family protein [Pseudomonadota bacterium]